MKSIKEPANLFEKERRKKLNLEWVSERVCVVNNFSIQTVGQRNVCVSWISIKTK